MPNPNRYEPENSNKNKGTWFWDYGEEIDSSFNINYTDKIKFQVQSVSYPPIPVEKPKESKPFSPMVWNARASRDRSSLPLVPIGGAYPSSSPSLSSESPPSPFFVNNLNKICGFCCVFTMFETSSE
ncbi:hypothetical protein RYX36_033731 [Vicia faba]